MGDSRLDKSLRNIRRYSINVGQKIENIQKTILYFISMFIIMSIRSKKKLIHAQKCIGECEYIEIGES